MTDKVNKIISMTPDAWESIKKIAVTQERSATAQVRHWINEAIRAAAEQDRLNEIEANAKVIELHEDRTA